MLGTARSQLVLSVLAFALASDIAGADGVAILDPSGAKHFSTIQAAVDAAVDGDVLLVAAGTYAGFSVGDKQLSILAAPETAAVTIAGNVSIAGSSKDLLMVGLRVRGGWNGWPLTASGNSGQLRFQDCSFTSIYSLRVAAKLQDSDALFSRCQFRGSNGATKVYVPGEHGSAGLEANDSRVALYSCTLTGGHGGDNQSQQLLAAGNGGDGLDLFGSSMAFIAKSTLTGGSGGQSWACGGWPWTCWYGSPGLSGYGVFLSSGSKAYDLDSPPPLVGGVVANHVRVLGTLRNFSTPRFADDEQELTFTANGPSGDEVFLRYGSFASFLLSPGQGVWTVNQGGLSFLGSRSIGVIGAAGTFSGNLWLPLLPQGVVGSRLYLQGYTTVPPHGPVHFGTPTNLLSLNRNALPDCNGNGTQDYLEIVQGLVLDINENLVPDECEFATTLYVDAAAASGGTGTQAQPFQAIGQAIAAAGVHGTVIVADGVYVGPGNRGLDPGTKSLAIRSANGPDNCILDCQGQANGFSISGPGTYALPTSIGGFTIRNGSAQRGGGVYVKRNDVTIWNCRILQCSASLQGGGVYVSAERARIEGCVISGNTGAGAYLTRGATVSNCVVEGNTRGGLVLMGSNSAQRHFVSHCTIQSNLIGTTGAGIGVGDFEDASIDNCLIVSNRAAYAGGGIGAIGYGDVRVTNSTLAFNEAGSFGGGVHVTNGALGDLDNTILWANFAAGGPQLNVQSQMKVEHCLVDGGQAGVGGAPPATLIWGPGNLSSDPLFESPFQNNYRLMPASPAIDAGNSSLVPVDVLDVDHDGNFIERMPLDRGFRPRQILIPSDPFTGVGPLPIVDMGCYELQPR